MREQKTFFKMKLHLIIIVVIQNDTQHIYRTWQVVHITHTKKVQYSMIHTHTYRNRLERPYRKRYIQSIQTIMFTHLF